MAYLALSIVSAVVRVLLITMKRVSSMLTPSIALAKSIGSTLARNLREKPEEHYLAASLCLSAS